MFVWRANCTDSSRKQVFRLLTQRLLALADSSQTNSGFIMTKLMVLLVLAGSLLSACATRETAPVIPHGGAAKPGQEGYCPPTQAIKGIC